MKRTLAFAASLLLLGACSSDGYTIRGKIAGLDNPYVYLLRYTGEVEVIDSAKVTKGGFVFKGKAEQPEVVYLSNSPSSISSWKTAASASTAHSPHRPTSPYWARRRTTSSGRSTKRSPPWKRSSPRPATTCSATACARSTPS